MANVLLAYNNRTDGGTLSGGSWSATLPLTNLQSRQIGKVARSTNLTLASTLFNIDITAGKLVRVVGFVNHNLSLAAKFRVRGGGDPTFATLVQYDSGWLDVYPAVYASTSLDWQASNWWFGRYTDEQRSGITPERFVVLPSSQNAQYWRIEFDDSTNTDGYVQFGRTFIGDGWQTIVNALYGSTSIAWETNTAVQEAISGAEYFDRRTPYRVAKFTTEYMTEIEGMGTVFDLVRTAGIDGEVVYIHDPDDTVHALRRQFMGRLRTLSPIEYPYWSLTKTAWEIRELL